jgi:hypothetical protein
MFIDFWGADAKSRRNPRKLKKEGIGVVSCFETQE